MEQSDQQISDPREGDERRRWFRDEILPLEPALRSLARRFARSGQVDLEDLIQDTFVRILGCATWREVQNPGAFAFSTLKNLALDAARRSKVISFEIMADIEQLNVRDERPNPESYAMVRDELGFLLQVIQTLPTQCRRVFTLRKVYDLSPGEIAESLGLSVSTVEKHLVKGVRICSELMASDPWPSRKRTLKLHATSRKPSTR